MPVIELLNIEAIAEIIKNRNVQNLRMATSIFLQDFWCYWRPISLKNIFYSSSVLHLFEEFGNINHWTTEYWNNSWNFYDPGLSFFVRIFVDFFIVYARRFLSITIVIYFFYEVFNIGKIRPFYFYFLAFSLLAMSFGMNLGDCKLSFLRGNL